MVAVILVWSVGLNMIKHDVRCGEELTDRMKDWEEKQNEWHEDMEGMAARSS